VLSYRDGSVRRMNVVRYRYRLRPGTTALTALLREWDRCRWVWNQAVARLNESGELSERVFVCESCGIIQERDRNAARVILDRAGLNPAGAEAVRHSDLLEVRVLAEPGIPTL
jgi:Helix-turn-helix domain